VHQIAAFGGGGKHLRRTAQKRSAAQTVCLSTSSVDGGKTLLVDRGRLLAWREEICVAREEVLGQTQGGYFIHARCLKCLEYDGQVLGGQNSGEDRIGRFPV
jgi:hypothetical protein